MIGAINKSHQALQLEINEGILEDRFAECSTNRMKVVDGTVHEARSSDKRIIANRRNKAIPTHDANATKIFGPRDVDPVV